MTPRDKGRPRRVLLLALLLVALSQPALSLLLDHRYPLLTFPDARAVLANVEKRGVNPEVVVLGSSRLLFGVLDEEAGRLLGRLGSVLNASVLGGDHTSHERILGHLLDAGATPRLVIVEVSPDFLNWYNFCAGGNATRLVRWIDVPDHLGQITCSGDLQRLFCARLFPVYQHRHELLAALSGRADGPLAVRPLTLRPAEPAYPARVRTDGPVPALSPACLEASRALSRRVATQWLRDYRVVPLQLDALRRVVATCRGRGCEVWLLSPPYTALHRSAFTPDIDGPFHDALASLGCRHIDGRDWLADGYFSDSHHLIVPGARRFTRLLVRRALGPWAEEAWR
jgi:hypothetical protein